jgi:molybdopterin/thiamine biosynthesis adenylyltransferase
VALVDNGLIEPVNSSQNIFFRKQSNLARSKAEVIADEGVTYFHKTKWIPLISEIADVGLGKLSDCSIIFSATDSALSRVETAYTARRLGIPMIDAGLLGSAYWRGRVAWFSSHQEAACYFCQLSENRRAEILALSHSPTLGCQLAEENVDMPSTPTMSAVVAGIAIDLAFRHGLPAGENHSFAWDIDLGHPPNLKAHSLTASSTCPFHHFREKSALIPLPFNRSFDESLRAVNIDTVELDWPIVVLATCSKCGCDWRPMRRLAWSRKHSQCFNCGETNHFRFKAIHRISVGDASARHTPADLSYSKDHLFSPVYDSGRQQS